MDQKFFGNESVESGNDGFTYRIRLGSPGYDSHLTFEQVYASLAGQPEVKQENTVGAAPTPKM